MGGEGDHLIRCEHGAVVNEWCGQCDDTVRRPMAVVPDVLEPLGRVTPAEFARVIAEAKAWLIQVAGFDAETVQGEDSATAVLGIEGLYVGGWKRFVANTMAYQGGEC